MPLRRLTSNPAFGRLPLHPAASALYPASTPLSAISGPLRIAAHQPPLRIRPRRAQDWVALPRKPKPSPSVGPPLLPYLWSSPQRSGGAPPGGRVPGRHQVRRPDITSIPSLLLTTTDHGHHACVDVAQGSD
ncbi:hypothetical protein E2562_038119 [Oryza meyeriana var. granulata]|uniref:Uncharacterized protein n=1 Tax=Oryza meyeriana var. granulata TaxID=110450 RepID=A0A6G1C0Y3_9ORYZ|nr:hypothetical protein E2562_038119 [Oryza meyeriana var. granulata]